MFLLTFEGWLETAPQWIASAPEWLQTLCFQFYQTFIYQNRWTFFTNGLKITFIVTIGALILGIIIGIIIGIVRTSYESVAKNKKPNIILGFFFFTRCRLFHTASPSSSVFLQSKPSTNKYKPVFNA